jgi:hypothetical protein
MPKSPRVVSEDLGMEPGHSVQALRDCNLLLLEHRTYGECRKFSVYTWEHWGDTPGKE